ncbi:MAG: hypothetical protein ACOY3N_10450 [Bradyrhizobium sp.]|jgi:hypothetical protein|uniref:hypothetical protein n=1 Tax=Bradyrhizobium TaxID=374 RepID=UPI00040BB2BE|nr:MULTISPECIES: hypothetical protein [Bradyrhizobium]KQT27576.1 hypothetical protein ASG57_18705 [Bradyrhizobium sp. Leaf396]
MPYFPPNENQDFRVCKVLADIFCAILIGTFSVAFFGWLGGLVAFVIVEASLLALDWLIPTKDDAAGVVR